MAYPLPPQIENALEQLIQAIATVDKVQVDPLKTPWAELEKSVIKLLGGRFELERPEHQGVALGLSGLFGARLAAEHQAFWFPNRESMEGAVMGFPDALIMLSPFGAVIEGLSTGKLARLDEVAKEIRTSLAQVKFAPATAGQPKLTPVDYQRLFDPGFVQFVVLDPAKAKTAWESHPDKLARDVKEALARGGAKLPPEARQQLEGQIVMALSRLDPKVKLTDQVDRAPRVSELVGHLFGTVGGSGSAPEEFWNDVVMPLLHIGVPDQFPPLDGEELEAAKQGADPLFLFLDLVPYKTSAPDDGLMGAFALNELTLPHPAFEKIGSLRLIKVNRDRIKPLVEAFDPAKTQDALKRFGAHLEKAAGQPVPSTAEGGHLLEAAMSLLTDLKKAFTAQGDLCLRRITEAEAASEAALAVVRGALNGPRIILG